MSGFESYRTRNDNAVWCDFNSDRSKGFIVAYRISVVSSLGSLVDSASSRSLRGSCRVCRDRIGVGTEGRDSQSNDRCKPHFEVKIWRWTLI